MRTGATCFIGILEIAASLVAAPVPGYSLDDVVGWEGTAWGMTESEVTKSIASHGFNPVAGPPRPGGPFEGDIPLQTKVDIDGGKYAPKPFSLASSVMIDDQTLQRFAVLPPVAPPGKEYFPDAFLGRLQPGQLDTMTIQFAAPPPPPSREGEPPPKQTVSFLLAGAKGAIAKVPIPPPANIGSTADSPPVSAQE
jgi:hypothetical protein